MKHLFLTTLFAFAFSLSSMAGGRSFSDEAKNNCQLLNDAGDSVTIIFCADAQHFNLDLAAIKTVYTYGSITAWDKDVESFRLTEQSDDDCLYRTFALSDLQKRGNSGQPEFLFQVTPTSGSAYTLKASSSTMDSRLLFINNGENMLLLFPGDDIAEIGRRGDTAKTIAPLSNFQPLTDSANIAHLTNFRRVPTTACLYRSYHPYNPDRAKYSTEYRRMSQLAQLGATYNIQSDIALSGDQTSKAGTTYTCAGMTRTITIPDYYQAIIRNSNVLYVGTENGITPDYNTAVFRTNDTMFGQWMQEVVRFINAHPAPFQIHCSLGADRTGAFCATLAALCGASWAQIADDYHQTSNLMIQEYRHPNCVRYELYLLTGEWPEVFAPTSPESGLTLQQAVAKHFIEGGYLTQDEIDACVEKLTTPVPPTSLQETNADHPDHLATKRLHNGQVYISHNSHTYAISGKEIE